MSAIMPLDGAARSIEETRIVVKRCLEEELKQIVNDKLPLSDYIITKSLKTGYKSDHLPHVQLVKKIIKRIEVRPMLAIDYATGTGVGFLRQLWLLFRCLSISAFCVQSGQLVREPPKSGQRIPFIIVQGSGQVYERAEDPDWLQDQQAKVGKKKVGRTCLFHVLLTSFGADFGFHVRQFAPHRRPCWTAFTIWNNSSKMR